MIRLKILIVLILIISCSNKVVTDDNNAPVLAGHMEIDATLSKLKDISISDIIHISIKITPRWSDYIIGNNPDTNVIIVTKVLLNKNVSIKGLAFISGSDSVWTDIFSKDSIKNYNTSVIVNEGSEWYIAISSLPIDTSLEFGGAYGIVLPKYEY